MKDNPYVGPRPYERHDRSSFFGRDREAQELGTLIGAEREVLFYAQSGAGKTSLLNAKVIPEIEEDGFLVLPPARVSGELPAGIEPDEVENVFAYSVLLGLAGADADPQGLLAHTLCSWLEEHLGQRDALVDQPVVLILDQFEEVFTTHLDRLQDVTPFFQQVREALDALPNLGVVLSMREDHVAEIDSYAPIFARRLRARFRMERLGIPGALDAIKRPAERAGIRYDAGVAERLVDDLRQIKVRRPGGGEEAVPGPYVEPVQLQVVCRRLWESLPEQEDKTIHSEAVARYGDVDRALSQFYERCLQQTAQHATVRERALRKWFKEKLITPAGTRGTAFRDQHETEGLPNAAVDVLVDLYLIRGELRVGARWYELTHDRFIEPIQQSNLAWEEQARRKKWTTGLAVLGTAVMVTVILVVLLVGKTDQLNKSEAQLKTATAQLNTANTQLETAAAQLNTANTHLETATAQLNIDKTQLETATAQLNTANTQLETATAQLNIANTQLETATAQLNTAKTQLETVTVLVVTLEALQTPTEPPTQTLTATSTPTQTLTATSTPTATLTQTLTTSSTLTQTLTITSTPTHTPTPTATPTATPTSTAFISPLPPPHTSAMERPQDVDPGPPLKIAGLAALLAAGGGWLVASGSRAHSLR